MRIDTVQFDKKPPILALTQCQTSQISKFSSGYNIRTVMIQLLLGPYSNYPEMML